MLGTWLTDRFGLEVPLVSAPMAGAAGGELAAAVSAAGALGMIGFAGGRGEDLERMVAAARSGGKPFGIGLLAWVLDLQPELLDVAIAAQPALISVSYGPYAPYVERIRAANITSATQVGALTDARAAAVVGVDVIVARGGEGGGHGINAVGTMPLLQAVLDDLDTPVLAAGGIAGPRGLAAVLAAGAAGAWVGTAFLACTEASTPPESRGAVLAASETDTVYTEVYDIGRGLPWPEGIGGRAVRTAFADEWHGRDEELRSAGVRLEEKVAWAGQGVGMLRAERPAADVVAEFATAEELLRRW